MDRNENVSIVIRGRISRRSFLKSGAAGGALAASAAVRPAAAQVPAAQEAFELAELTIAELQAGMKSGKYTARGLVEAYLARIEALDRKGPSLHQVIETNPDAVAIAGALDAERKAKGIRGPLHGIPVLVKDNIDTADRMSTTAGSYALLGSKPPRDAFLVRRLREAGAIILGKTNLSEWANFRSSNSSSGWSGRGGQGRNPYALDRTPCGSSSGSAAAVSANLCAVAVGTETDGSIVCPSGANSIVGIKPTVGLVSRSGIIPIAHSQDTAGPMARTVADAALLLGALTGVDARDPATSQSRGKSRTDYTRFLDPRGLQGARIGVARENFFGQSEKADRVIEEAIREMRRQGAVIVDPTDIPKFGEYDDSEMEVLLYEFKDDLNRYLAALGPKAPVHTLEEIIDFNERNTAKEMRFFEQDLFLMANEKGPLTSEDYVKALENNHRLSRTEGIDAVMDGHKLDALIAPTGGPPWTIDLVNGDHFTGSSSTPAAVSGYPSITVPAGYVFGLPIGISFIGRAYSEPLLIRIAYSFEQAFVTRKPPRFLPSADLA